METRWVLTATFPYHQDLAHRFTTQHEAPQADDEKPSDEGGQPCMTRLS
jgi:hypothetical protein